MMHMGRFNGLIYVSDKKCNISYPQNLLDSFHSAIEECNLKVVDLCDSKYTWEKSISTNDWVRKRLDKVFFTESWWSKFSLYNLRVHHTSCSDHNPIHLDFLHTTVSKKVFRFQFENT